MVTRIVLGLFLLVNMVCGMQEPGLNQDYNTARSYVKKIIVSLGERIARMQSQEVVWLYQVVACQELELIRRQKESLSACISGQGIAASDISHVLNMVEASFLAASREHNRESKRKLLFDAQALSLILPEICSESIRLDQALKKTELDTAILFSACELCNQVLPESGRTSARHISSPSSCIENSFGSLADNNSISRADSGLLEKICQGKERDFNRALVEERSPLNFNNCSVCLSSFSSSFYCSSSASNSRMSPASPICPDSSNSEAFSSLAASDAGFAEVSSSSAREPFFIKIPLPSRRSSNGSACLMSRLAEGASLNSSSSSSPRYSVWTPPTE